MKARKPDGCKDTEGPSTNEQVSPVPGNTGNEEKTLLPLTASEFRAFNRMAEKMDYFHNHFRKMWRTMDEACEAGKKPAGMSISQFLSLATQFCSGLEHHHDIEEANIFPALARKMPAFRKEFEMPSQHKLIHKGLLQLQAYVEECRNGVTDFRFGEMKSLMNGFGEVLWQHLAEEVEQLGAENMRRYWTLQEMRSLYF